MLHYYFFDIDGTMIGDILPQLAEWEIINKFEKSKLNIYKKNLQTQLENGILRPHLASFIDTIKTKNTDCEIFIYTASDGKWANFIVAIIEKIISRKFNRPLFTRKHCVLKKNGYQKSIRRIEKFIKKSSGGDVFSQSILFDNNFVLMKQEEQRLYICPTYNYKDVYDVTRLLSENVLYENYYEIAKILSTYGLFPDFDSLKHQNFSYNVFKSLYFSFIGNNIRENLKNNLMIKDNFWMTVIL